MAVSDLVTNAARKSATQLEIALTSTRVATADGSTSSCACCAAAGDPIGEVESTSSLMRLARLVHAENGRMTIEDARDGSHVFELTWPSSSQPSAVPAAAPKEVPAAAPKETVDA